eukprot:1487606-Pyramimonas_sp.AAC.1
MSSQCSSDREDVSGETRPGHPNIDIPGKKFVPPPGPRILLSPGDDSYRHAVTTLNNNCPIPEGRARTP